MTNEEQAQELGLLVLEQKQLGTKLVCLESKRERALEALNVAMLVANGSRDLPEGIENYPTEEDVLGLRREIDEAQARREEITRRLSA